MSWMQQASTRRLRHFCKIESNKITQTAMDGAMPFVAVFLLLYIPEEPKILFGNKILDLWKNNP